MKQQRGLSKTENIGCKTNQEMSRLCHESATGTSRTTKNDSQHNVWSAQRQIAEPMANKSQNQERGSELTRKSNPVQI